MRVKLAQGIARDQHWHDDALNAYRALEHDPDVGGEAMMRLGAMQLRQRRLSDAVKSLDRADSLARDPYVVYLARSSEVKVKGSDITVQARRGYFGS